MKSLKSKSKKTFKTILSLFTVLFSVALFASCSDNEKEVIPVGKSPVVLVHGAWQGAYVWDQIQANLIASGYRVSVVKLPGHGDDATPAHVISFQDYVNQVKNAINAYNEPVILVGHSLGGAIITQTASELPKKVTKLIYVAGFIPQSGKSVLEYSQMDAQSLLPPTLQLSEDQTLAGIVNPGVNLPNVFCQDGTDAQKQFLVERYKAEPTIPLGTPLSYKMEDYKAAGKKYYIFTTEDNTISFGFQQKMATDAGILNTYEINAGHSPFISKPTEFTAILKEISKK